MKNSLILTQVQTQVTRKTQKKEINLKMKQEETFPNTTLEGNYGLMPDSMSKWDMCTAHSFRDFSGNAEDIKLSFSIQRDLDSRCQMMSFPLTKPNKSKKQKNSERRLT